MNKQDTISPAFPFQSNYIEVKGAKMHYIDEGEGDPILFLHGNPTSSYLWRNVIPHVTALGRCIAPDLMGFGKSDKPESEYRFYDHADYLDAFIEALGLTNITLVIHDWGSALGFHYASRHADNMKGIAFMEALLMPTPSWDVFDENARAMFQGFRTPEVGWDMLVNQNIFIEQVVPHGIMRDLSDEEMAYYRAPFTETASRKPIWQFPNDIPIANEPEDMTATVNAYNQWLQASELPKLLIHATPGALTPAPLVEWCQAMLKNLTVVDVGEGLHYLQEDNPHGIGQAIAEWMGQ